MLSKGPVVPAPTRQFYSEMLSLEEQLGNGSLSRQLLNQLITQYARCVEVFDRLNNPISFYFSQKILHTLSRQSIIKSLCGTSPESKKQFSSKPTIRREARLLKANMTIEKERDMKSSESVIEQAQKQMERLEQHHLLIAEHIEMQRDAVQRKIMKKKQRRLKTEPTTNWSDDQLTSEQISLIMDSPEKNTSFMVEQEILKEMDESNQQEEHK